MVVPSSGMPDDEVDDEVVEAPDALARLGQFRPEVATAVTAFAARRHVVALESTARTDPTDDVELFVPAADRDDLRAQLVLGWDAVMSELDPDVAVQLRATGGNLPGWSDAPGGVWVDRAGRLQVARADEEELEEDARRTLGPGMTVTGALLLLLAWYVGPGDLRWSAGVAGVLLGVAGLFIPR